MTKEELTQAVKKAKNKTSTGLQALWDLIPTLFQSQILQLDGIKELFDLYGVEYTE